VHRSSLRIPAALAALALPFSAALAETHPAELPDPAAEAVEIDIPFEKVTLENGLEVILHQDRRIPLVSVNVWVHVGAFHEPEGRSGFAHLFEHLMFEGSAHAGHPISVLERLGASQINGTTSFDRTNYFQTVPSHHLETVLWLEADRMGFLLPAITQENLDLQRNVVKNERRQRYDAAPYGLARLVGWNALFPEDHPFHNMVIGSMEDLAAASMEDVYAFFDTWYTPANATVAIAGDFDRDEALALVEKYFGTLPARPRPERPDVTPVTLEETVVIHHDEPIARLPMVNAVWLSPPVFQPGDAEADVLASVLSTGRSSRLQRRLVFEKQIAQSVSAYQWSIGHQGIFGVQAVARPGVDTDTLLAEIDAVLAEVREEGVTDEEVVRAINRTETQTLAGLQSLGGFGGRADQLQYYNHHTGNPGYIAEDIARYRAVTPEAVQTFAKTVLDPERRLILHAIPAQAGAAPETEPEAAPETEEADADESDADAQASHALGATADAGQES
jgi:zinc protease